MRSVEQLPCPDPDTVDVPESMEMFKSRADPVGVKTALWHGKNDPATLRTWPLTPGNSYPVRLGHWVAYWRDRDGKSARFPPFTKVAARLLGVAPGVATL